MKIPQVLLLGNGINRAFDSDSWDDLLNSIDSRSDKYEIMDTRCPETLKAILVTNDRVDAALADKHTQLANLGTEKPEGQMVLLRRLLDIGFDDILTANYSYGLEAAAFGEDRISENALKNCQRHTPEVKRCEANFMLHTYNAVTYNDTEQKIWHIHGEARKPDSMILGHYYYGTLLGKILSINKKRGRSYFNAQKKCEQPPINNTTDALNIGYLYVLS